MVASGALVVATAVVGSAAETRTNLILEINDDDDDNDEVVHVYNKRIYIYIKKTEQTCHVYKIQLHMFTCVSIHSFFLKKKG